MNQQKIDDMVELVCSLGCKKTREIMDVLESGNSTPETINLDKKSRNILLSELSEIMAVYDQPCDI